MSSYGNCRIVNIRTSRRLSVLPHRGIICMTGVLPRQKSGKKENTGKQTHTHAYTNKNKYNSFSSPQESGAIVDCGCGESVWHLAAIIIGYLVGLLLMFLMAAMVWYGISLEPRRAPSTGDSALFYEDEYARAAGGAYVNEDVYAGAGYHHGMGTMSTLYGNGGTMQRRQVVADTYGSEFYPASGAIVQQQLPYSVPGSGTLGRRTIGSASTMGRGATMPKIAITPAGSNLRQRLVTSVCY